MKPDLLYFDARRSSFVLKDLEILRTRFRVRNYTFDLSKKWLIPLQFARQFFIVLFYAGRCKAVIVQFAGYHCYLPFLVFGWFGKKRIIVAGGTDCVSFPSFQYGNFSRKYLRWFTAKSFQKADLILPVHESLIQYDYVYQDNDFPKQGYRYFVKNITAREKVIYNGYDPSVWYPRPVTRRKNSFLTVGLDLNTRFSFALKGIDLFVTMARSFPEYTFTMVGADHITGVEIPANVTLMPTIPNNELPLLYSTHEYYVQLSMSEGFPNALTESILCGCIPIVSNVGAMPMIVRDEACILKRKNSEDLLQLVRNLVATRPQTDFAGFVKENFSFESRKEIFLDEVSRIIDPAR